MPRLVVFCPDCWQRVKLAKNGSIPEHISRWGNWYAHNALHRRYLWIGKPPSRNDRCNGTNSGRAAGLTFRDALDSRVLLPPTPTY